MRKLISTHSVSTLYFMDKKYGLTQMLIEY